MKAVHILNLCSSWR